MNPELERLLRSLLRPTPANAPRDVTQTPAPRGLLAVLRPEQQSPNPIRVAESAPASATQVAANHRPGRPPSVGQYINGKFEYRRASPPRYQDQTETERRRDVSDRIVPGTDPDVSEIYRSLTADSLFRLAGGPPNSMHDKVGHGGEGTFWPFGRRMAVSPKNVYLDERGTGKQLRLRPSVSDPRQNDTDPKQYYPIDYSHSYSNRRGKPIDYQGPRDVLAHEVGHMAGEDNEHNADAWAEAFDFLSKTADADPRDPDVQRRLLTLEDTYPNTIIFMKELLTNGSKVFRDHGMRRLFDLPDDTPLLSQALRGALQPAQPPRPR